MLCVQNLGIEIPGMSDKPLLSDITATCRGGTVTLLVGSSGAGKSTLLQVLAGLLAPSTGTVELAGTPLYQHGKPQPSVLRQITYVPQFPEETLFASSVMREVRFSLRPYPAGADSLTVASQSLRAAEIPEALWPSSPLTLSGGYKRRVATASAMATPARWLLFDEPTAGLDAPARARWLEHIRALRLAGDHGIVIATHSVAELLPLADVIWVIQSGRLVGSWSTTEILQQPAILQSVNVRIPEPLLLRSALADLGVPLPTRWTGPDELATLLLHALPLAPLAQADSGWAPATAAPLLIPSAASAVVATNGRVSHTPSTLSDRLDARAKWLFFLSLTISIFLQQTWEGLAACALIIGLTATLARIRVLKLVRPLQPLLWVSLVSTMLSAVRIHAGHPHLGTSGLGWLHIQWPRAAVTARGATVFLLSLATGILLSSTISPSDLKRGLETLLRPLRRLGLQPAALSLALTLILRFLPLLGQEVRRFSAIASARGKVATRPGRLPLRFIVVALIPLLLSAMRLAEEYAIALEARGFKEISELELQTSRQQPWQPADWWTVTIGGLLLLLSMAIRV